MTDERRLVTRLGLQIPSFTYPGVPTEKLFDRIADIATTAEDSGFDSLWVMDHLYQIVNVGPPTDEMLEAYTLLAGIGARTSRVKLGTMVTGVTYRNPALLAKIVTTLDIVSAGRAILGIGAAWNEDEHRGYGFDFPPVKERMERLEEAVQICRAMFRDERPTFQGKHHRTSSVLNLPKPVQPNGPPILIGGSGEKKTLRLVATYADACNLFGDAGTVRHKLDVLRQHCQDVGRDYSEITTTRLGTLVIGATHEEAERRGARFRASRGIDEQTYRLRVMEGSPEEIVAQVGALMEATGLDGLLFNMEDVHDLELVALAGETLTKAMA